MIKIAQHGHLGFHHLDFHKQGPLLPAKRLQAYRNHLDHTCIRDSNLCSAPGQQLLQLLTSKGKIGQPCQMGDCQNYGPFLGP